MKSLTIFDGSTWASHSILSDIIIKSWHEPLKDDNPLSLNCRDFSSQHLQEVRLQILKADPDQDLDHVFFPSPYPDPFTFLSVLSQFNNLLNIKLLAYPNFIHYVTKWNQETAQSVLKSIRPLKVFALSRPFARVVSGVLAREVFVQPIFLSESSLKTPFKKIIILAESPKFVYIGRAGPQKNLAQTLQAFYMAKREGLKGTLYWGGFWDFHDQGGILRYLNQDPLALGYAEFNSFKLYKSLLEKQFPGCFIELGRLSHSDCVYVLSQADCFVSSSTFLGEDFGLAAHLAWAMGKGLILSNWGGHRDILEVNLGSRSVSVSLNGLWWSIDIENLIERFLSFNTLSEQEEHVHRQSYMKSFSHDVRRPIIETSFDLKHYLRKLGEFYGEN